MYFPKSQIKPNLYTNGGEYVLSTTKEDYKGYYYKTSTGQQFTGKTPQDGPNIPLLSPTLNSRYTPENKLDIPPNIIQYFQPNDPYVVIKNINTTQEKLLPQPNPTFPTQSEQDLGVYTRYFCKKNNELKYMEIDKTTFQKLNSKSNDIAWDLYTPISTLWYTAENEISYKANKGLISLIEKNQKWYGFTQWFKDKF
jgi:hypothetical protein